MDRGLDVRGSIRGRSKRLFSTQQELRPTKTPIHWAPGVISLGLK
jgi:hypothetical protein